MRWRAESTPPGCPAQPTLDYGRDWMPLSVSLAPGAVLDDRLQSAIRTAIREGASPRHLPGQRPADVVDLGAVDRPHVLVEIADLAAARSPS